MMRRIASFSPVAHFPQGLPAGSAPIRLAGAEAKHILKVGAHDLAEWLILPRAEINLPQLRFFVQFQLLGHINSCRCLAGAL